MTDNIDHWEKVTAMMVLYERRRKYQIDIAELKSQGDNISDNDLLKLLLLTKTVIWYDEHIKTLETGGYSNWTFRP